MKEQNVFCHRVCRALTCGLLLACCVSARAESYYWTGASDAFWTNAANWRVGSADGAVATVPPGLYDYDSGTKTAKGVSGDTTFFGSISNGRTTIDLSGEYQIKTVTILAGAPSYTFGLEDSESQRLGFEKNGTATVQSGVTTDQRFRAQSYAAGNFNIVLGSASSTLYLGSWRTGGVWGGTVYISGVGVLVYDGSVTYDTGSSLQILMSGRVEWGEKIHSGGTRFQNTIVTVSSATPENPSVLHVPAGRYLYGRGGGGPFCNHQEFRTDCHVTGDGMLCVNHYYNDDAHPNRPGVVSVYEGKRAVLDIGVLLNEAAVNQFFVTGNGTLTLNSTNTVKGSTVLFGKTTVEAKKLGFVGCTAADTSIAIGGPVIFANNYEKYDGPATAPAKGTLAYTGAAATSCDRTLSVTNTHATTASVTLSNRGGGTLTWTGPVTQLGATSGAELVLNAKTADISFAGGFESGKNWSLKATGSGTVSFPEAQPNLNGAVKVEGGTLSIANGATFPNATGFEFAGGSLAVSASGTLPGVKISSGKSRLVLAEGVKLTLVPSGTPAGVLDVIADEGAELTVDGAAAGPTDVFLLNGDRAKFDANGKLIASRAYWREAVSGNWNEGAKWNPAGVPLPTDSAYVNAAGSSYVVSVSDNAADGNDHLFVENATDGETARVDFGRDFTYGNGADVSVGPGGEIGSSGTARLRFAKGSSLTLAGGGALRASSGSNFWDAAGNIAMATGTVAMSGTARLVVTNRAAEMVVGTGSWSFEDESALVITGYATDYRLKPGNPGETATVSFVESARIDGNYDGNAFLLGGAAGGVSVLNYGLSGTREFITDAVGQNAILGYRVGVSSGLGILNITSGNLRISNAGFHVGCTAATTQGTAGEGQFPTGIVNQTGGKWYGGSYKGAYSVEVHGTEIGSAPYLKNSSNRYRGIYNLSGGTYEQSTGLLIFGAGPCAEGDFNVSGGTFSYQPSYTHKSSKGTDTYNHPLLIGFAGGTGRMTQSGGSASVGYGNVCVGGELSTRIGLTGKQYHDDLNYKLTGGQNSTGVLTVTGGTFKATRHVIVGADGAGTVALGGTGRLTCVDLVLSNQVSGTLSFKLPPNGRAGWTLTATNIVLTSGAKLVVDARGLEAKRVKGCCLATAIGEVTGTFDPANVTFLYDPEKADLFERATISYERKGQRGLWLDGTPQGGVIIVR